MLLRSANRPRFLLFLIQSYLFALLFDAILRKWLLPGLSSQVMMIKQVIAILIVLTGIFSVKKFSGWEKSFAIVGLCVLITSLIAGHGNLAVTLYGCLPYWFGLTISYIIGKTLCKKDLLTIGKLLIYTSIFNSLLIILQYILPVNNILNYTGGKIAENITGLSAAELAGIYRPAGIFMHATQSGLFMLLSFTLILYFLLIETKFIKRKIIITAGFFDAIACVCSVSRTVIFIHIGTFLFFSYFCSRGDFFKKTFKSIFYAIPIIAILMLTPFGQNAINNILTRFDEASRVQYSKKSTIEGTLADIWNRNVNYNVNAIINPHTIKGDTIPFWGYGQGISTQIGGKLLNIKTKSGFALAEFDGLRIMCESGYIFGWIIIFIRLGYSFRFVPQLGKLRKHKKYLSIVLFPPFLISFYLINTWGNVFLSNWAFLCGGLFLAAYRVEKQNKKNKYENISISSYRKSKC